MSIAFAFPSEVEDTEAEVDAFWTQAVREGLFPGKIGGYPDTGTLYMLSDPRQPYQGNVVAAKAMFILQRAAGSDLPTDDLHLKCLREWQDEGASTPDR